MKLRDRYGWPLELYAGKPITNFFRRLILTDIRQTWAKRRCNAIVTDYHPDGTVTSQPEEIKVLGHISVRDDGTLYVDTTKASND